MSEKEISQEVRNAATEIIKEMMEKFVDGVIGVENLFSITVTDLDWTIKRPGQNYEHKIYYERLKMGEKKNEN